MNLQILSASFVIVLSKGRKPFLILSKGRLVASLLKWSSSAQKIKPILNMTSFSLASLDLVLLHRDRCMVNLVSCKLPW